VAPSPLFWPALERPRTTVTWRSFSPSRRAVLCPSRPPLRLALRSQKRPTTVASLLFRRGRAPHWPVWLASASSTSLPLPSPQSVGQPQCPAHTFLSTLVYLRSVVCPCVAFRARFRPAEAIAALRHLPRAHLMSGWALEHIARAQAELMLYSDVCVAREWRARALLLLNRALVQRLRVADFRYTA